MAGTWQVAAASAAVGLAVAVVTITTAGPWEGGQRTAERAAAARADRAARSAADQNPATTRATQVLKAIRLAPKPGQADHADLPLPTPQGLQRALGPVLDSAGPGTEYRAAVMDPATGTLLYGLDADEPAKPASTIKTATAVAALHVLGPDHRITTSVVQGAGKDRIVLVGGGDPTLTAVKQDGRGPGRPASLRKLAEDTARALKKRGVLEVELAYDTSVYTGDPLHPIGVNDNLAPVTALMTDEGRQDPTSTGPAPRHTDPAAEAAKRFAGFLEARGIKVTGVAPGTADRTAGTPLAQVHSPPLSDLVERALTDSDNDIAEALARQTALAMEKPASFEGAAEAVTEALQDLGLPLQGARILDGSGLNSQDALSAELLARILAVAASPAHPELRPALSGLPVAGFTGTLQGRYTQGEARGGAGLIRAKTGTLTGVSTLAGTVVDADGRLLTFAFMSEGATNPATLDRLAATLATCGCR